MFVQYRTQADGIEQTMDKRGDGDSDAAEQGVTCACGYENFERVVVERVPGRPIVTDFLACVGCRTMFFAPRGKPKPPAPRSPAEPPRQPTPKPAPQQQEHAFTHLGSDYPRGWVDPAKDTLEQLKADAEEAAKAYRKPGRSGRLGPGGRR